MARNEEKAQAMLNKWLTMKKDLATGAFGRKEAGRAGRARRPHRVKQGYLWCSTKRNIGRAMDLNEEKSLGFLGVTRRMF